jgi:hypothetical protein
MTVDCQWIEKNLEAVQSDRLNPEEIRLAKAHIERCASCKSELQALNAVDPIIKSYFQRELQIARRPRAIHKGRVLGFSGAAAVAVIVLLLVVARNSQTSVQTTLETPSAVPEIAAAPEPSKPVKVEDATQDARSKPTPDPSPAPDRRAPAAVTNRAPDFLVSDPAGYSHTLDEYRGRVVLLGVWAREQADVIANIERLYKAYGANAKIRFLGVTSERKAKPANTTFPVLYNEGSKLLGVNPGEFVLLNESGAVELRGSLVRDFEPLSKALRVK